MSLPSSTATALNAVRAAGDSGQLFPTAVANITAWLEGGFLPGWAIESILELVSLEAWEELNNRFYKYMEFGTGGMRGRTMGEVMTAAERGEPSEKGTPAHPSVGTAYLNDINVVRATMGLFRYCQRYLDANRVTHDQPKLVIACDVRHFSRHFTELAASAWSRLGGRALIFEGPRSTPQLSFTVRHVRATAGVVITASHNPPHDNGFKAYFEDGGQVTPPHDSAIIEEVNRIALADLAPFLEKDLAGVVTLGDEADQAYFAALEENIEEPDLLRGTGLKVVFTPIHGTGAFASVPLMKRLGVEVHTVEAQDVQDPRFPTVESPNPENSEALTLALAKARESGADLVLATDPDADRMGVAVRSTAGDLQLLTGNQIGSILAEMRLERLKAAGIIPAGGTRSAALIKTFVTTPLQAEIGRQHGIKVIDTLTGFKWIGRKLRQYEERMLSAVREKQGLALDYDATCLETRRRLLLDHSTLYVFGGEESYGYLASDRVRDKDANAAVILFCEAAATLKAQGKTVPEYLDSLYLKYGFFLEDLVNIYYEGASGAGKIKNILNSYREKTPRSIGSFNVTSFRDFGREDVVDADGDLVPKQAFFMLELDNGYQFAVRGSGTEPKIKFYLFAREQVSEPAKLEAARERAREVMNELKQAIEADARSRAG